MGAQCAASAEHRTPVRALARLRLKPLLHPLLLLLLLLLLLQGPFPASNMVEWHAAGYLHDMQLPVCGTVSQRRKHTA